MRLSGIMMVRNEADVIEASVRHNLTLLDDMVIIDHGSFDGTGDILASLQREGLPLRILRDESTGFFQAERITTVARETLAREPADFVFAIDTDEFLKCPGREVLERALAAIEPGAHTALHWLTYVPTAFESGVRMPDLRWRRKTERHGSLKCVIGRSFVERPKQYVVSGNHLVDDLATPEPPPQHPLPDYIAALAHWPVRSREQLERKIVLGYLAHFATSPRNDQQARHWRELFERLRDGAVLADDELADIAFNCGLPTSARQARVPGDLVEDPIVLAFELRYRPDVRVDTLRLLMRFTESLLRH